MRPVPGSPTVDTEGDLRWSLKHPGVRYGLALVGLISLLLSLWNGVDSRDPWSPLIVAVVCAFLAFPRFVGKFIKSISLPGGAVVDFVEAPTAPGAATVAELVGQTPQNLGGRRLHLAQLRTAGVQLRNRGIQLNVADLTQWLNEVAEWSNAVATAIDGVNSADAEWFRTLDAVPPPRIGFRRLCSEHEKAYRELDFMLKKLDTLIVRYAAFDRPKDEPSPATGERG